MVNLQTEFAPPERDEIEEILRLNKKLKQNELVLPLLSSTPALAVILNSKRQIILANDSFLNLLNAEDENEVLGKRVGEALACIYCDNKSGGCGTTKFCKYCGAVNAILNSQEHKTRDIQECMLLSKGETDTIAFNFLVWSTPFEFSGEYFTIFSLKDISSEKYRQAMERIFFHDVINLASGIHGIMELLPELSKDEIAEFHLSGVQLAGQLISEIESQRELSMAERGELQVKMSDINVLDLLNALCTLYRNHNIAEGKILPEPLVEGHIIINSDRVLLTRVLGNLIKNALEASDIGQKVQVSFCNNEKGAVFSIHNEGEMPEYVKLQIFKRSFSTKSEQGRGLGTYSIKLLTEKYLKGKVDFTSTKEEGTTFTVNLH